ncbi:hypothetical protein BYT27DRAFT_6336149 [Phlegmacium glaucopus]|nr:hypothetical protein BYT27DRAFT_6336149 [Phlegmacium glaucopus]
MKVSNRSPSLILESLITPSVSLAGMLHTMSRCFCYTPALSLRVPFILTSCVRGLGWTRLSPVQYCICRRIQEEFKTDLNDFCCRQTVFVAERFDSMKDPVKLI